jgi:hypothetical protein
MLRSQRLVSPIGDSISLRTLRTEEKNRDTRDDEIETCAPSAEKKVCGPTADTADTTVVTGISREEPLRSPTAARPDTASVPAIYAEPPRCPAWIFDDSLAVSTADVRRSIAEVTGIDTAASTAADSRHAIAAGTTANPAAAAPSASLASSSRRVAAGPALNLG